jgi:hypothetical protein
MPYVIHHIALKDLGNQSFSYRLSTSHGNDEHEP